MLQLSPAITLGLGLETTKTLQSTGATVIVSTHTSENVAVTLSGLSVEAIPLDILASTFLTSGRPLYLLINNTAIMASPLSHDSRGSEAQLSTNRLGHFRLTAPLSPAFVFVSAPPYPPSSSL
jgi:NAD(P)-dependent dehydrogenase (short-subunit alcohol dehydrogenase family)